MDKNKLLQILQYNREHQDDTFQVCQKFYHRLGKDSPVVIPEVQTFVECILESNHTCFVHIPLKSKEIGAFHICINQVNYVVLNTTKSRANNNFALMHELYHLLFQDDKSQCNSDIYLNNYSDDDDEMAANAFAASMLMPRDDFKKTAQIFWDRAESFFSQRPLLPYLGVVYALMRYFATTYMAVVIRCFELKVFDENDDELMEYLLAQNDYEMQADIFGQLSGESHIMKPSYEDDFETKLYQRAEMKGHELVERGLITEEDLEYRLEELRMTYERLKEGNSYGEDTDKASGIS